jgi:drug/metabolite transporter (DMT)-like permease
MLSILFAFLGYSILNISQASQKIGLQLAKQKRFKGLVLWAAATAGTSLSVFFVYYAVALGRASLVGAITPTGLVSLAVFSYFVMKEKLYKKEIAGIAIILSGAALIAFLSRDVDKVVIHLDRLFILMGIVCFLYIILIIIFFQRDLISGILIGGLSGALGGFIPLLQKVSSSSIGQASTLFPPAYLNKLTPLCKFLFTYLANVFAVIWVGLSLISVVVLQFSYKRNKAILIIPCFSANATIIPLIGGVICFQEELHALQWLGVVFILGGLFLLTIKIKKNQENLHNPS